MIKTLRLVEIELFSYCNRKCNWCPNREIDRHSFNSEIDNDILSNVLSELSISRYEGAITFSRYNEPLSHIEIFRQRLKEIRRILPSNKLITNTNGDYLTRESLRDLPLNELTIMDYDRKGVIKCIQQLEACDAHIDEVTYPYILASLGDMKILYFTDWLDQKTITDRGGFLSEYSVSRRQVSCFEPMYFVGINYDGTVSPCCNVRNDIPALKPYILGDLHDSTLNEILISPNATKFRCDCCEGVYKEGSPCYYCSNKGGRYTQGGNGIRYE